MTPLHPPLTDYGRELLSATLAAHAASCDRTNISSQTVINAACGSGDYTKAIASAILTIGGLHAPLEQSVNLLRRDDPRPAVAFCLHNKIRVPGWGNSFEKGHPDPLWEGVHKILFENEMWASKFGAVTASLHSFGKMLFPNPSAYTAATAIEIGLPPNLAAYIFIAGRLSAWTGLVGQQLNLTPV